MTKTNKLTLTDSEYEAIRSLVAELPRDRRHASLIAAWQAAHDIGHADGGEDRDRQLYKVAQKFKLLKETA